MWAHAFPPVPRNAARRVYEMEGYDEGSHDLVIRAGRGQRPDAEFGGFIKSLPHTYASIERDSSLRLRMTGEGVASYQGKYR